MSLVISSSFTPSISIGWFLIFSGWLISIALFILVSARLALHLDDFYGGFFCFFCIIVSINAAVNMYFFVYDLNSIQNFVDARLSPAFGRVPDHYPTTGAMTYATGLVGASGLFIIEKSNIRRLIAFLAVAILAFTLCLTQSRGPILASLFTVFILLAVKFNKRACYYFIAAFLLAIIVFILNTKIGLKAMQRLDSNRIEIWSRFANFVIQRPILGYGERLEILMEINDGERLGHAHNIFLSAFMRGGVLALAGLLAAYSQALYKTFILGWRSDNLIPFALVLVAIAAGGFDFDQLIFLADWQWISYWFPIGLAVACERRFEHIRNINTKIEFSQNKFSFK